MSEVAPPYSIVTAIELTNAILDAINGSQPQGFIKEIKGLGEDVKFTIDSIEQIHSVLIQEDTHFNVPLKVVLQAEKWKAEQEKYKTQIRLIKGAAEEAKVDAIHPFVRVWSPMVLEKDPDEDVLIEFQSFSEKLATIQAPVVKFDDLLHAIKMLKQDCDSKMLKQDCDSKHAHSEAYNPKIKTLNEDIYALESKMQAAAVTAIEELVPGFLKLRGLDGYFSKLLSLLSPLTLVRALKCLTGFFGNLSEKDGKKGDKRAVGEEDGRDKQKPRGIEADDLDALGDVSEEVGGIQSLCATVEDCENKLREKHKRLDELQHLQENSDRDQSRLDVCISLASQLGDRVAFIAPKLESIAKMAGAVKGEVDNYITFLNGPDCKNIYERQKALAEIGLAKGMYTLLDNALEDFVTQ